MKFNFTPRQLAKYYRSWSKTYDADVQQQGYVGPKTLANLLGSQELKNLPEIDVTNRSISIMDAGCGTGLVGRALEELGYAQVFGSDLSEDMAEIAQGTGCYRGVDCNVDLHCKNSNYVNGQYDVVMCCGTFTTGHVKPDALSELVRITRPSGLVLVSVRRSYYDGQDFGSFYMEMIETGQIELVHSIVCGPYLQEEDAHYFAFRVLRSAE